MKKITPHLWFDKEAQEAANFYVSVFDNSKILEVNHYGDTGPEGTDSVMTVAFELDGQQVIALNAGPHFKLNEAFSFYVDCESQEEVDDLWEKLTADGGEESQCGWLKDRFGVSWQIIPKRLGELLQGENSEGAARAMAAMLQMKKIDVETLEKAYAG